MKNIPNRILMNTLCMTLAISTVNIAFASEQELDDEYKSIKEARSLILQRQEELIRLQEMERERIINHNKKVEIYREISWLNKIIRSSDITLEKYNGYLDKYKEAQKAFDKIDFENIKFTEVNGKKWFMEFDLKNNSEYEVISYNFVINLKTHLKSSKRKITDDFYIKQDDYKRFMEDFTGTSIKRIMNPKDIEYSIEKLDFAIVLDNKKFMVFPPGEEKKAFPADLVKAIEDETEENLKLKARLTELGRELESLKGV